MGAIQEGIGSNRIPGLDILSGQIGSTNNNGISGALFGAGGLMASVTGRGDIGQFLEDAGRAVSANSSGAITDFLQGQIGQFASAGDADFAGVLEGLLDEASSGLKSPDDILRLASNELLSRSGLDANGIQNIINADPNQLTKGDLQNLVGTIAESVGRRTGDEALVQAGGMIRTYTPEKIQAFNQQLLKTTAGERPSLLEMPTVSPGSSSSVGILGR